MPALFCIPPVASVFSLQLRNKKLPFQMGVHPLEPLLLQLKWQSAKPTTIEPPLLYVGKTFKVQLFRKVILAAVLNAAAGKDEKTAPKKQLSLSDCLEQAALTPLRNTLKLKSQRLRKWDLDIHYSSKDELVSVPCQIEGALLHCLG